MVFSKYFKQTFQNTVSFDCFVLKIKIWIQPGLVIVKFSTENRCMYKKQRNSSIVEKHKTKSVTDLNHSARWTKPWILISLFEYAYHDE